MPRKDRILEIGKKFGMLTVLSKVEHNGKGRTEYLFRCDCGTIKAIAISQILQKKYPTISCGCKKYLTGPLSSQWRGHGEIPSEFFNRVARGAKDRKLSFNVTIEYLWELFLKQDKKCKLSGLILEFPKRYTPKERSKHTASLDRIDNKRAYEPNNVQWVHKRINMMKNTLSDKEFIDFCTAVANNNKENKWLISQT